MAFFCQCHSNQHSEKLGSWCSREYSRNSNITEITVVNHQSRNIRVWNQVNRHYLMIYQKILGIPCTSSQGDGRGWRCPPCPTSCATGQDARWNISRWLTFVKTAPVVYGAVASIVFLVQGFTKVRVEILEQLPRLLWRLRKSVKPLKSQRCKKFVQVIRNPIPTWCRM